ncbi:MAG: hypothetical protein ABIT58_04910 [Ferruginibacter sp.]
MGIPKKYKADFVENEIYHVYNKTNNKELLFINDADRILFLKKFDRYTSAFLEPFSWNLLLNHFHTYVRVKSFENITNFLKGVPTENLCLTERKFLKGEVTIHKLIDNVFKRLFISYTICFNKCHKRKGNLFHRPFKHVLTEKESQFSQTIIYINANAVKHGLVTRIEDYKWSSYFNLISDDHENLLKQEVLDWFGGKKQFIKMLKEKTEYYHSCESSMEDDSED